MSEDIWNRSDVLSYAEHKNANPLYVVYFAYWCHHCVGMIKKLGDNFNQDNNNIVFIPDTYIGSDLDVPHFPYLHVVKNGKISVGNIDDIYNVIPNTQF